MSEMMRESPGFLLDGAERKRKEGGKKDKTKNIEQTREETKWTGKSVFHFY